MNKLSEKVKELFEKFKSQSKKVKIAMIVAVIAVIMAVASAIFYASSNKYGVLFSNLDPEDAKTVVDTLTKDKVDTKLDSSTNTIYVPKNQVDKLKLEMAPTLKGGSTGYELMDEQSSFGMTDEEFKLKKKRMIEGELEKNIKYFDSVENAKVSITQANTSIFSKDSKDGTASVTLSLKNGTKLSEDQVKSIVALVSASVEGVPKENVSVVDQNMNWLTKDISFDENDQTSASGISKRQQQENEYKETMQKQIISILEPIVGKGKVKAQVSVTLNYDSKQKTETVIDPNKVIVSQETIKEFNGGADETTGDSPVDNNMSNEIVDSTSGSSSTREEQKTNYDSGKSEIKTITAPGEVERITASVVVDKKDLSTTESEQLQDLVSNAIGLDNLKGHKLTVVGMQFDTSDVEEAKSQLDQMNAEAASKRNTILMVIGGVAIAVLIGLAVIFILRRRKKNAEEEEQLLDTIIDDTIVPKEPDTFDPIEFETKNEKAHLESEIKKYATEKPEQVVEIIKSWLNENEG